MTKRSLAEWDLFQLQLAKHYSTMSRDPSTRVGAVVTDKDSKHVYGLGYNGFPPNVNDDYAYSLGREFKLANTIHAEINAINAAKRAENTGKKFTLFVYPFIACLECAKVIASDESITRLVTLDFVPERWQEDFTASENLLRLAGVEIVKYDVTPIAPKGARIEDAIDPPSYSTRIREDNR